MALPWPMWSGIPDDWDREFFFYHGDYEFDRITGRTLFRIGGVTREDNTILLELYGHHPRCYFKTSGNIESARDLVRHWEVRARQTGYAYFGSSGRWIYDQISDISKWVLNVSARVCEDMVEDRPSERVGIRYCVEFAHPSLVKMFREYVLYCHGRESEPRVPTWCLDESVKKTFSKMLVYEANVDYVERVIIDKQYPPSVWYKLKRWDRTFRATSQPMTYDDTGKRYDLVVRAHIDDIAPTGDETPHASRVIAYDIEAQNQDGDHMPRAADNEIIDIVVYAYREGHKEDAMSIAFELKSCKPVVDKAFFFNSDEGKMLQQFRKFIIVSRCDAVIAHNGNGFDLPYMIERAKVLKLVGWDYLGPLRRKARITHSTSKGFKKHNAYVPGLLILDTMSIERETLNARSLGLADCALRYLDNMSKMEVYPDELSRLYETFEGRSKIHEYCMRDAKLVCLIEQAQRGIRASFDMARRSIPAQTVLNRAQGAKGEGAIAREAMKGDRPRIMLVLSFMSRFMRDRPQTRVRGEYQGDKEYEGAINLPPVPIYISPMGGLRRKVVLILDFRALYPSIMQWRNISIDTELRPDTIRLMGYREGRDYWSSPDYVDVDGRRCVRPVADNPKFVNSSIRRGLIPIVQDRLAADRRAVKARMSVVNEKLLDGKDLSPEREKELRMQKAQLSLEERTIKLLMNSIYGLMARLKSGDDESDGGNKNGGMIHSIRYVSMAVASAVTREGRGLIMLTRDIIRSEFAGARVLNDDGEVEDENACSAEVIGGDTDSVIVAVETGDDAEAFELGRRMEAVLNSHYEEPIHIGLEGMAISFEQYRKKNYKMMLRCPRPNGTWSEPEMIVKGESWKKRNFPRNLRKSCKAIADILLSAKVRDDRLEATIATMRKALDELMSFDVPVGDLMESSKLSMDLKDYNDPGSLKGPAMLMRKYEADVLAAELRQEAEPPSGAGKRKSRRAVDVYRPGAGDIASYVIVPVDSKHPSSKVTSRTVSGLEAIRAGTRYDANYYSEQLFKTVSSSFGQALATLSGSSAKIEHAVRDKLLDFDAKIDQMGERLGKLKPAELKRYNLMQIPREREAERTKKQLEFRKAKYLELTKRLVGPYRSAKAPETGGIMSLFKREPRCSECGLPACACDHRSKRDEKRSRLETAKLDRRNAWDKCAKCVGGRPEEAERCRSFRACPNFSWRTHLDFRINRLNRDIGDIEDLMLKVGQE